ncbi:MAG: hypothetical protein JWO05_625 [Gemmatimonadetes bacterium]|nr:hypothetical protein [Gemmatimonadota bacterium]
MPVDCHAHSTFSDGALSVAEVVAVAASRGVVPSVTDHITGDVTASVKSLERLEEYLAALEQQPVLRGGEFCYHDALWREVPPAMVARFTHRVGSLHAIQLGDGSWLHAWSRSMPEALDSATYMEAHLATLERFASEMPVDILAHPTLVALAFRKLPSEELFTPAHEERMTQALAAAGIAFEVSNRYRPHARLVRTAISAGCRISLGSDGHTALQVADVQWPLELTRSLGYPDEELYDPRAHGSRTGARAA